MLSSDCMCWAASAGHCRGFTLIVCWLLSGATAERLLKHFATLDARTLPHCCYGALPQLSQHPEPLQCRMLHGCTQMRCRLLLPPTDLPLLHPHTMHLPPPSTTHTATPSRATRQCSRAASQPHTQSAGCRINKRAAQQCTKHAAVLLRHCCCAWHA